MRPDQSRRMRFDGDLLNPRISTHLNVTTTLEPQGYVAIGAHVHDATGVRHLMSGVTHFDPEKAREVAAAILLKADEAEAQRNAAINALQDYINDH